MGDSAGVGPEITAKAWKARELHSLACFFAVGDPNAVEKVWDGPIARITDPEQANDVFAHALPVLAVGDTDNIVPGVPNDSSARMALQSLEVAVGLASAGAASGVVTGPVSKAQLYGIGFTHPGQTEFVAERCGISGENAVMMLAGPTLRVVPLTV
ncbi:MAG: 4-hydroxythreonine-4-phosphate dehydrogenase, partial [Sphingomonadales bacterium]